VFSLFFEHTKLWVHCICGYISCVGSELCLKTYQWWPASPSVFCKEPRAIPGSWATYLRQLCRTSLCEFFYDAQVISVQNTKIIQACLNFNFHLLSLARRTQCDLQRSTFREDNYLCVTKGWFSSPWRAAGIWIWLWTVSMSAKAAKKYLAAILWC